MKNIKRCMWCRKRIWGTARLYAHCLAYELVLQGWVHDGAKAGQKPCDQQLTERITKAYSETGSMIEAVAPFIGMDTRKRDGVLVEWEQMYMAALSAEKAQAVPK